MEIILSDIKLAKRAEDFLASMTKVLPSHIQIESICCNGFGTRMKLSTAYSVQGHSWDITNLYALTSKINISISMNENTKLPVTKLEMHNAFGYGYLEVSLSCAKLDIITGPKG